MSHLRKILLRRKVWNEQQFVAESHVTNLLFEEDLGSLFAIDGASGLAEGISSEAPEMIKSLVWASENIRRKWRWILCNSLCPLIFDEHYSKSEPIGLGNIHDCHLILYINFWHKDDALLYRLARNGNRVRGLGAR